MSKLRAWVTNALHYRGDDCLLWPYGCTSSGYPGFHVNGKNMHVHRFICEWTSGPPPSLKHHARHSCDNKLCANPRHLSWGTSHDNQKDRKEFSRYKLTPPKVAEIRRLEGVEAPSKVGARFGVTERAIRDIWTGRTWRPDAQRLERRWGPRP